MDRTQALEIAQEFIQRERVASGDFDWARRDSVALARSLEAILPDIGGAWALVEWQEFQSAPDDPKELCLLALHEGTLFVVGFDRTCEQIPLLSVDRWATDQWRVNSVSDRVYRDEGSAVRVVRVWNLTAGDERFAWSTDHLLLHDPTPTRDERMGRALAADNGWEVGDLSADQDFV